MEEVSGEPPPWVETEESEVESGAAGRMEWERIARRSVSQPKLTRSRETSSRGDAFPDTSQHKGRSRKSSHREAEVNRSGNSSRLSHILERDRSPPKRPPLPDLPRPELSHSVDDGDEIDTLSSRRASLFRSSPRANSRRSLSPSFASIRRSQDLSIPPQHPIRVGMALLSTPQQSPSIPATAILASTPHPPGRWQSSPASTKANVRFSSPRSAEPKGADRDLNAGDVSIHRLKLSPAKTRSPKKHILAESAGPDTSFLRRLSRVASQKAIPQPSTTLRETRSALARAAEASSAAQAKVERTQRQWLETLASIHSNAAVEVMRKGWGWGTWAWWISMEILLVWGVFR